MKRAILLLTCIVCLVAFIVCPPAEAARKSKVDQEREAKWQEIKKKAESNQKDPEKTTYKVGENEAKRAQSNQPAMSVDDGSGGNSGSREMDLIIDLKSLAEWMKENNSTPAQVKAYDRYRAARGNYDAFLAKSAEMVKAMDRSTGSAREDLLNKLRLRKNEEQSIVAEMRKAQAELLVAFPKIKREQGKK